MTTFPPISTVGGRSTRSPISRPGARSDGLSTPAPVERTLEFLEHAHHAETARSVRAGRGAVEHAAREVGALQPQRLVVWHPRAPRVARARDVLAVGGEVLVEALVV